jgi:hypothetical protein
MTTTYYGKEADRMPLVFLWLLAGLVCLLGAWLLPVSLKSVHPILLEFAAQKSPTLSQAADTYLMHHKYGPADRVVEVAKALREEDAQQLAAAAARLTEQDPDAVFWGGRDPQIEMLFSTNAIASEGQSLVRLFMNSSVRDVVSSHLKNSPSPGVQAVLRTRQLEGYQEFVPANKPGGQPLEATIALTALFYGGEYFSPGLMNEIKGTAERAAATANPADIESIYHSLLVLANRFNWVELTELFRVVRSSAELRHLAALVNDRPDDRAVIFCATVQGGSAAKVSSYLSSYGAEGLANLSTALGHGQGAVAMLLDRQLPLATIPGPVVPFAAPLIIKWPHVMLAAKYFLFGAGGFALLIAWGQFANRPGAGNRSLFGVQQQLYGGEPQAVAPKIGGGFKVFTRGLFVLALLGTLVLISEPMLLKKIKTGEIKPAYRIAGLANTPKQASDSKAQPMNGFNQSTIVSVLIFALLQILYYMVCLMKIREIDMHPTPPSVKLRLMENEENLFDGGLYLGIAGTAAALVMQVMQVIDANLLAAYSSNLFGIVCVAFIKIGHVRSFKRQLILQMQAEQGTLPRQ